MIIFFFMGLWLWKEKSDFPHANYWKYSGYAESSNTHIGRCEGAIFFHYDYLFLILYSLNLYIKFHFESQFLLTTLAKWNKLVPIKRKKVNIFSVDCAFNIWTGVELSFFHVSLDHKLFTWVWTLMSTILARIRSYFWNTLFVVPKIVC